MSLQVKTQKHKSQDPQKEKLTTLAAALSQILAHTSLAKPKKIKLSNFLGLVLAEPVVATLDSPGFNNAAVDGYGVRLSDVLNSEEKNTSHWLHVVGEITAGSSLKGVGKNFQLKPNEALRIFTGAPVPSCVDAVVMQERCQKHPEKPFKIKVQKIETQPIGLGDNIRRKGEEYRRGEIILPQGLRVTPPVIGVLASLGLGRCLAYPPPKVALILTGNELVRPEKNTKTSLKPGQIYDSNRPALVAALAHLGVNEVKVFHAKDTEDATQKAFQKALDYADVVISVGGISVGDYDFVKRGVESLGVETVFWGIALKPGKPVYFGVLPSIQQKSRKANHKLVFGLPGNPVSALVTFQALVTPALLKWMGQEDVLLGHGFNHSAIANPLGDAGFQRASIQAILEKTLWKQPGRLELVRGVLRREGNAKDPTISKWFVSPTVGQDSHMLSGLAFANCLIVFPENDSVCHAGDPVEVTPLLWSLGGGISSLPST
ncbi:MAG: molybdopterin molybdotransferase MoeA [Cyanobacteria bacterium]|nr:molybdopterin molybdotransferase MoeA [Cyanobacteriota bacterium]